MSFPTIPQITPSISINRRQVTNLLLSSIAFEELGLAHIINAEAEKIQAVIGTLPGITIPGTTLSSLILIDRTVNRILRTVLKTQMLLQFKLEDICDSSEPEPPSPPFIDAGSAWSVGTDFGTGNAQYTTLEVGENEKSVILGLGANYIPVGTVDIVRDGNTLHVTISTDFPYIMDQVHLYVSNVVPVSSNPGGFPYQYTVNDPNDYFTTHIFDVDITAFAGQTLYIAAHAHVLQQI